MPHFGLAVFPDKRSLLAGAVVLLAAALSNFLLRAQPVGQPESARVKHVSVTSTSEALEIEIQTSTALVPESQAISAPDRIVIDFPGALPAPELRALKVNQGALKSIRTGLFSANPPITRVVLDLSGPQAYQISARGNSVMLKLAMTAETNANSAYATLSATPPAPPAPPLIVDFQQGLLRIHAQGATLSQVLFEVQKRTGADIPIPSGAEEEVVAVDLGPAPPKDVLAALLNGSRYNFIFVDDDRNHSLQKAILSVR